MPRAVSVFAATGLLAVVAVGVVSALLVRRIAVEQAVDTARRVTQVLARSVVQPALTDAILRDDPAAVAAIDRTVRREVLSPQILRVKLWTSEGRIVYSDEPRLIGAHYTFGAADRRALSTGEVVAAVSDLSRPENRFERRYGKLLEVYLRVRTPGGAPLLFEAYLPFDSVNAAANRAWLRFAPALVLALLALWALQLPFAASLAHRIRQGREERERLLQGALEASDAERRRIGGDLHDGVIQDLAGLSYGLVASADRVGGGDNEDIRDTLQHAGASVRETVRQLRGLLVEIYPPNLQATGLGPAISDLLAPLASRGIQTSLDVPPYLRLDADEEALLFRGAREALRNVATHAGAGSVRVGALCTRCDRHAHGRGRRARVLTRPDRVPASRRSRRAAPARGSGATCGRPAAG